MLVISGRYGERNAYWITSTGDHFSFGWGGFVADTQQLDTLLAADFTAVTADGIRCQDSS